MKKVDFNKLQAGDLVEVPRTQFAPMRRGWNGWLFSEAVVIRKGVGRKSKKNVVVVEMRTPAGKNSYGTIEATFYAENVFTTPAAKNARNILKKYGITESVRKLSVYGWRCSHSKGRHGRTAVCSSNTEAVRNAGEIGEADSDSKGIYRHAGEFRPPAHYRGRGRRLRRVSGSVQTVCRP